VEVDVDFGNYGILDVDVSVGGGIHPTSHIQKKIDAGHWLPKIFLLKKYLLKLLIMPNPPQKIILLNLARSCSKIILFNPSYSCQL
jgi:hypothetical protein